MYYSNESSTTPGIFLIIIIIIIIISIFFSSPRNTYDSDIYKNDPDPFFFTREGVPGQGIMMFCGAMMEISGWVQLHIKFFSYVDLNSTVESNEVPFLLSPKRAMTDWLTAFVLGRNPNHIIIDYHLVFSLLSTYLGRYVLSSSYCDISN